MAARLSAKKLPRYGLGFKRKLTPIPGMPVRVVAKALDLHPVMPSRWRQEAREGQLCGASQQVKRAPKAPVMKLALKAAGLPMRDKEAGPITWRGWMNKDGR